MPQDTLQLEKFLPYRLSVTSNLVSQAIANAYVTLFDLTIAEWRVIAVIAEGSGITQQEVCVLTRMDKVTVSRAAIALTERGLIDRTPNPRDGRSHILALSAEGAELYGNVAPKALELETRIFGALDPADIARLSAILEQVADAAEKLVSGAGG